MLIRGSWVRVPPGSQISLFSPQLLGAGVFSRDGVIGSHKWFKPICCKACGFESRSRHYLPYGVIGNTTDFGSVIGESYSSGATLYNNVHAYIIIYILAIYKKQYNCKNAWRVFSTLHFSPLLSVYYLTITPTSAPKNRGENSAIFFVSKNASSPCILCQIFFCHTLYDKNI